MLARWPGGGISDGVTPLLRLPGEMAEWLKAAVLKTVRAVKGSRGFKSHSLLRRARYVLCVGSVSTTTMYMIWQ